MPTGEVISVVSEKGFGFLKPSTGGADVFFHSSVVQGQFDELAIGQQVEFEADNASAKPRARSVRPVGAAATGRDSVARPAMRRPPKPKRGPTRDGQGRGERAAGRYDAKPNRPAGTYEFGFITKLHRNEAQGFISANKPGTELVFSAAEVSGEKSFNEMKVGDYVRFQRKRPAPEPPAPPLAIRVQIAERRPPKPGPELPPNPKARRQKPTWR